MNLSLLQLLLTLCLLSSCLTDNRTFCIPYRNNQYGAMVNCTSTSDSFFIINATATVNTTNNSYWKGSQQWTPYIVRNLIPILNLSSEKGCSKAEPNITYWNRGSYYKFSVKCSFLSIMLQRGDWVLFKLFQITYPKNTLGFVISIPGYFQPIQEKEKTIEQMTTTITNQLTFQSNRSNHLLST